MEFCREICFARKGDSLRLRGGPGLWPGLGKFIGIVLQPATGFGAATVLTPSTMAALLTVLVMTFLFIGLFTVLIARTVDPRLRMDVHAEDQGVAQ